MEPSQKWLFVRIGILLSVACAAFFSPVPVHPDFLHPAPLKFLGIIFGFSLFGATVVVSSMAKRTDNDLCRPSWFVNPLIFSQVYNYYEFASHSILASGFGFAAGRLLAATPNWFWEIPVTAGIGGILGVRAAMLGERNVTVPGHSPNQSTDPTFSSGTSRAGHEPRHR
jgi:hypothetical protein